MNSFKINEEDARILAEFTNNETLKLASVWGIDWVDMMQVVEKIEKIKSSVHGNFGVYISSNSCTIQGSKFRSDNPNNVYFADTYKNSKLEATYESCLSFIKWYNEEKYNT